MVCSLTKFLALAILTVLPWSKDYSHGYYNCIAWSDDTTLKYPHEDTFLGHHTIANRVENGTAVVAFFPDLGHLDLNRIADLQAGADWKGVQRNAFGGDIFGEVTGMDIESLCTDLGNAFHGQYTDLAMPIAGVGVSFDAVVYLEAHLGDIRLLHPFGVTDGNGYDSCLDFRVGLHEGPSPLITVTCPVRSDLISKPIAEGKNLHDLQVTIAEGRTTYEMGHKLIKNAMVFPYEKNNRFTSPVAVNDMVPDIQD